MSYEYRLKYKKDGPLKYISHLDLNTLFCRTIRRAQLPVELTQGYNPRFKISFGPTLPLGFTGLREVLDISLLNKLDNIEIKDRINNYTPQGFEVLEVDMLPEDDNGLSRTLKFAAYHIRLGFTANSLDYKENELKELVWTNIQSFLDQEHILVEKRTKKGLREVDLKPYIESLELIAINNSVTMRLIIDIQYRGSINPIIIINNFLERFGKKEMFLISEVIREKIISNAK